MSSMVWDAYAMGITPELGGLPRESLHRDNYRVSNKNKTIEKDNKEWFATANEAQEWAKKNIGKTITRSPDGNGYIVKN